MANKVCPRLRETPLEARGGITQPRTNIFGHLCSLSNGRVIITESETDKKKQDCLGDGLAKKFSQGGQLLPLRVHGQPSTQIKRWDFCLLPRELSSLL